VQLVLKVHASPIARESSSHVEPERGLTGVGVDANELPACCLRANNKELPPESQTVEPGSPSVDSYRGDFFEAQLIPRLHRRHHIRILVNEHKPALVEVGFGVAPALPSARALRAAVVPPERHGGARVLCVTVVLALPQGFAGIPSRHPTRDHRGIDGAARVAIDGSFLPAVRLRLDEDPGVAGRRVEAGRAVDFPPQDAAPGGTVVGEPIAQRVVCGAERPAVADAVVSCHDFARAISAEAREKAFGIFHIRR